MVQRDFPLSGTRHRLVWTNQKVLFFCFVSLLLFVLFVCLRACVCVCLIILTRTVPCSSESGHPIYWCSGAASSFSVSNLFFQKPCCCVPRKPLLSACLLYCLQSERIDIVCTLLLLLLFVFGTAGNKKIAMIHSYEKFSLLSQEFCSFQFLPFWFIQLHLLLILFSRKHFHLLDNCEKETHVIKITSESVFGWRWSWMNQKGSLRDWLGVKYQVITPLYLDLTHQK